MNSLKFIPTNIGNRDSDVAFEFSSERVASFIAVPSMIALLLVSLTH